MESFNKAKPGRSKINHNNSSFKSKFCLCFKPVSSVDDAASFEPASFSTILSSSLMTRERTDCWRRSSKKKGDHNDHTCFWQILKKAFNTTSLMKKIKRRKAANRSKFSRSSIINMKLEKNSKRECKISLGSSNSSCLLTPSSSTNSSSSSHALGSSSSPSSSITTTISLTTPNLRGQKKGTNLEEDNRTKALCYILVTSLLILILWGKVLAIICTSFWLYLLPRRCQQSEPPGPAHRAEEAFDTVEHKKKVIMEGLLERNRSRLISMDPITRPCS